MLRHQPVLRHEPVLRFRDLCDSPSEIGFTIEVPGPDDDFAVWMRSDDVDLTLNGDVLMCAGIMSAMKRGVALEVPLPVSARLLGALPDIQRILSTWFADFEVVEVTADEVTSTPRGELTGLYFSGGADSFFSALELGSRIDALVHVVGMDVKVHRTRQNQAVRERLSVVARELDRPLVGIETNIRYFADRELLPWGIQGHGMALAACAHAAGSMFAEMNIASSNTYAMLDPRGSHPSLDPLWSSEALRIVHHAPDVDRLDKFARLASEPVALSHLRVCWNQEAPGYENCGTCVKCVTAQLLLHAVGGLDRCSTFAPTTFDSLLEQLVVDEKSTVIRLVSMLRLTEAKGRGQEAAMLRRKLAQVDLSGVKFSSGWLGDLAAAVGLRSSLSPELPVEV